MKKELELSLDLPKLKKKEPKPKIEIVKKDRSRLMIALTLLSLIGLTIYTFFTIDTKGVPILGAIGLTLDNIRVMFTEAHLSHLDFAKAWRQIGVTFSLGFLTTVFAAVISFFLSLLAAKNLTNAYISNGVKNFVAFIRAVPTVLWVLIFAISAGLGAEAAVVGLSFHAIGYLVKAYSEAFEEMDQGPIEALRATGAGFWQIVFQAIIPSTASIC